MQQNLKLKTKLPDYENNRLPSKLAALRIAGEYLQTRIRNGSNPKIIYEHGVHVFNVAKIARAIARETDGRLNPETAYILGLLHDVGRIKDETVTKIPHGIEGFRYLTNLGYSGAAPICLTHNFIDKDIKPGDYPTYSPELFNQTKEFLSQIEYNDYDRLIQLGDLFSRGKEILSIRQRLDKNKQFYKIKNLSYEDKAFALRDYFDDKFGIDVEKIVAETFDLTKHTKGAITVFLIPNRYTYAQERRFSFVK